MDGKLRELIERAQNEVLIDLGGGKTMQSAPVDYRALAQAAYDLGAAAERERWVAVVRDSVRPKYLAETVIAAELKRALR